MHGFINVQLVTLMAYVLCWPTCCYGRVQSVGIGEITRHGRLSTRHYGNPPFVLHNRVSDTLLIVCSPQKTGSSGVNAMLMNVFEGLAASAPLSSTIDPTAGTAQVGFNSRLAQDANALLLVSRAIAAVDARGSSEARPATSAAWHLEALGSCRSESGWHSTETNQCRDASGSITSRGLLRNPRRFGWSPQSIQRYATGEQAKSRRASYMHHVGPLEAQAREQDVAVSVHAANTRSKREAPVRFVQGAHPRRILAATLPPVLITARHPASRFVSALLNKVIPGLRIDGARLPAVLGDNITLWTHPSRSHLIGPGHVFAMPSTRRHPWGPNAHNWRNRHLSDMLRCIALHGAPGSAGQAPRQAPAHLIRSIRKATLPASMGDLIATRSAVSALRERQRRTQAFFASGKNADWMAKQPRAALLCPGGYCWHDDPTVADVEVLAHFGALDTDVVDSAFEPL